MYCTFFIVRGRLIVFGVRGPGGTSRTLNQKDDKKAISFSYLFVFFLWLTKLFVFILRRIKKVCVFFLAKKLFGLFLWLV